MTKTYLTLKDKVLLMKTCGDASTILFEYYLTRNEYNYMDDANTAKLLGWTKSKVEQNRLRLIKNKYMDIRNGKMYDGRKIQHTTLGLELVLKLSKDKDETIMIKHQIDRLEH
jgi:hypothetical protein